MDPLTLADIAADTRCRVHDIRRCTICIDEPDDGDPTESDIDWGEA